MPTVTVSTPLDVFRDAVWIARVPRVISLAPVELFFVAPIARLSKVASNVNGVTVPLNCAPVPLPVTAVVYRVPASFWKLTVVPAPMVVSVSNFSVAPVSIRKLPDAFSSVFDAPPAPFRSSTPPSATISPVLPPTVPMELVYVEPGERLVMVP